MRTPFGPRPPFINVARICRKSCAVETAESARAYVKIAVYRKLRKVRRLTHTAPSAVERNLGDPAHRQPIDTVELVGSQADV
jgi:hypothetical protein